MGRIILDELGNIGCSTVKVTRLMEAEVGRIVAGLISGS
jgi:hypothetical protein